MKFINSSSNYALFLAFIFLFLIFFLPHGTAQEKSLTIQQPHQLSHKIELDKDPTTQNIQRNWGSVIGKMESKPSAFVKIMNSLSYMAAFVGEAAVSDCPK